MKKKKSFVRSLRANLLIVQIASVNLLSKLISHFFSFDLRMNLTPKQCEALMRARDETVSLRFARRTESSMLSRSAASRFTN